MRKILILFTIWSHLLDVSITNHSEMIHYSYKSIFIRIVTSLMNAVLNDECLF